MEFLTHGSLLIQAEDSRLSCQSSRFSIKAVDQPSLLQFKPICPEKLTRAAFKRGRPGSSSGGCKGSCDRQAGLVDDALQRAKLRRGCMVAFELCAGPLMSGDNAACDSPVRQSRPDMVERRFARNQIEIVLPSHCRSPFR
jgi:hypothetical protein